MSDFVPGSSPGASSNNFGWVDVLGSQHLYASECYFKKKPSVFWPTGIFKGCFILIYYNMENYLMRRLLDDSNKLARLKVTLNQLVINIESGNEILIAETEEPALDYIISKLETMRQELNHYRAVVKSSSC